MGLAGIAGVFVGFGALIAVRSGGASDAFETTYMRFVVWLGMLTVVEALAPVTLSPYGLGEHEVWVLLVPSWWRPTSGWYTCSTSGCPRAGRSTPRPPERTGSPNTGSVRSSDPDRHRSRDLRTGCKEGLG